MENDDGVGGIGDIDDSALDDAEKADAEDNKSNDNAGGEGTSEIKNELEQALQETLGQNFLNSKDMEDLMMGVFVTGSQHQLLHTGPLIENPFLTFFCREPH